MFNRILIPSNQRSFFLFGARGTGKSTWLKQEFLPHKPYLYFDLLDPNQEEKLSKDPNQLKHQVEGRKDLRWIVIDEVQKVPKLLNVVHQLIEKKKLLFALTGSSARKLKRGQADLLAGRAFVYHLFPLTHIELENKFDLSFVLQWGSLPEIFNLDSEKDKILYLKSYTQTYLKEEILVEQVIRKLDPFRQFLEIASQQNGEIVNYSNLARDVGVDTVTVQSYFQILEDTLVGHLLPAFHKSLRKRQRQNPKFYFFDLGVARSLSGLVAQTLQEHTYGFGKSFEQFVILEAIRCNHYFEKDFSLSYLRTKDDAEIDLIVERPGCPMAFVEIKSSTNVDERDVRTLKLFKKNFGKADYFCLSRDETPKIIDGISLLPWNSGLKEIGFGR